MSGLSLPPYQHGSATCGRFGKAILTRSEAKSTAKRDARRTGLNMQAYQCRTCGGWHVGNRRFG